MKKSHTIQQSSYQWSEASVVHQLALFGIRTCFLDLNIKPPGDQSSRKYGDQSILRVTLPGPLVSGADNKICWLLPWTGAGQTPFERFIPTKQILLRIRNSDAADILQVFQTSGDSFLECDRSFVLVSLSVSRRLLSGEDPLVSGEFLR